jgi:hypothetical protein
VLRLSQVLRLLQMLHFRDFLNDFKDLAEYCGSALVDSLVRGARGTS